MNIGLTLALLSAVGTSSDVVEYVDTGSRRYWMVGAPAWSEFDKRRLSRRAKRRARMARKQKRGWA